MRWLTRLVYRRLGKRSRHCRLDKSRRDICRQASMCVRSIYTAYQERIQRKAHRSHGKAYNHGQKSWDTFSFLGRFRIHTGPSPPLTPQTMLNSCIQNFFGVPILNMVGGGRTARKFRKRYTVLRGNQEITEKYEYCDTIPRTILIFLREKAGPNLENE